MAVNNPTARVVDFWPKYKKIRIITATMLSLLTAGTVAVCLVITGTAIDSTLLYVMIFGAFFVALPLAFVLIRFITAPLEDIWKAVVHVSGEPSIITPPNPNLARYKKSGFKPLLETIYGLSSSSGKPAAAPTLALTDVMDDQPYGFVIMNAAGEIAYANPAAPIDVTSDDTRRLSLVFDEDLTLEGWLKDCEARAVNAEHTWQRVANKLIGEDGRKLYDLAASYKKGAESEVVLFFIEHTADYQPEDDDLDFIAFAAHELRGPITVIRGYLDVLRDELAEILQDDQEELMNRLIISANRLTNYINNILNVSRYDRRHLSLHLTETTIAEVYTMIADDMQLRAQAQNRYISTTLPDTLPTIAADPTSLSEVFSNLIDNAIKYSSEGGMVTVTAREDGGMVAVVVEDHGIGIPKQLVSNLFHKFYRSHRSRETVAGTGIGLYISKAIVESHGGHISVRSTEGKGSVFSFSLPTYASVAKQLMEGDNSNKTLISASNETITNHSMYRG